MSSSSSSRSRSTSIRARSGSSWTTSKRLLSEAEKRWAKKIRRGSGRTVPAEGLTALTPDAADRARAAAEAERLHQEHLQLCRRDPDAFIEYVGTDDDGNPLRQALHHREWQALFSAHRLVAILGHAEAGKTVQVGLRVVWELGRDPTTRVLLLGSSTANPEKVLGVIRRAIESNPKVREVFPDLRPDPAGPWTTGTIRVAGALSGTKDNSVLVAGLGTEIIGSRLDLIVVDDIHNDENSSTPHQRKKIQKFFDGTLQSRRTRRGRVWVIGNAWHRDDLLHTLAKRESWTFRRFPVIGPDRRSRWPEQFPPERIAEIRKAVGPLAFARMYLCLPLDDEAQRFRQEWLDAAVDKARRLGVSFRRPIPEVVGPQGAYAPQAFAGVDLSSGRSGRRRKTDQHAIVVGFLWPDGTRVIIDVRTGRWPAPQLLAEMRKVEDLYHPLWFVEDNSVQNLFLDVWKDDPRAPLARGFTTGSNKWDPTLGVEALSILFENSKIAIATDPGREGLPEEVDYLFEGLLYFSPSDHTNDAVMATWIYHHATQLGRASVFDREHRAV
jgi:hypothetical protein